MKPDWKDAPEWANYLVMDDDGRWFWFESQPRADSRFGCWMEDSGRLDLARQTNIGWQETMEARPE